jgi:hypothetical protein
MLSTNRPLDVDVSNFSVHEMKTAPCSSMRSMTFRTLRPKRERSWTATPPLTPDSIRASISSNAGRDAFAPLSSRSVKTSPTFSPSAFNWARQRASCCFGDWNESDSRSRSPTRETRT